jgi:hypothetical protein
VRRAGADGQRRLLAAAEISGDALPGLTAKEDYQLGAGGFQAAAPSLKKTIRPAE